MRYISALGMHSKAVLRKFLACIISTVLSLFIQVNATGAELVERIVAIVNDEVILLSEFQDSYQAARESDDSVSEETVLNGMINSMLLLIEAKRFRIGDSDFQPRDTRDNRAVIKEYIDRRIKTFIHIPPEDIESYYSGNSERFAGKDLYDVRDEIEEYLVEKELGKKLHEYIEELRNKAYIRIQLQQG